jgi:hypothetical protein
MRPKPGWDELVKRRWACWLQATKDRYNLSEARLAYYLRQGPADVDEGNDPRNAVRDWLRGKRYISAQRAFEVGEQLQARLDVPEGGLVSAHGAGHFGDVIAAVIAMLQQATLEERAASTKAALDESRDQTDYALKIVAGAWTANADADGIPDSLISADRRALARALIGAAPTNACRRAWESRTRVKGFTQAIVAIVLQPRSRAKNTTETLYPNGPALAAWAALTEYATQHVLGRGAWYDAWRLKRQYHDEYVQIAYKHWNDQRSITFDPISEEN